MGKGKGKILRVNIPKNGEEPIQHVFVNSAGDEFEIVGLSPLMLPSLAEGVAVPKKPTYTVETVGGDVETHEHDETTLQTEEDHKAWNAYKMHSRLYERELTDRILACVLLEGVVLPEDLDVSRWEKRQRMMGITVPQDEEEKMLLYKRSQVIKSTSDIEALIVAVMGLTGVDQGAIDLARQSFPDTMEPKS